MAGIGFELKQVFEEKDFFSSLKAYGYSIVVCVGPIFLAVMLQLILFSVANIWGISNHDMDILTSFISYTMTSSLICSSLFSSLIVRYIADCIYEKKTENILSSFWGSTLIELLIGGIGYFIFSLISGVQWKYMVLNFSLFMVMIVVWNAMNYLSVLRNYKQISLAFLIGIIVGIISILIGMNVSKDVLIVYLFSILMAYGTIMVCYCILLYRAFPIKTGKSFDFLSYLQYFSKIMLIGFLINIGLFGHIIVMLFNPYHKQLIGLFYQISFYEIPALFAILSIFITIVRFNVVVETSFYPFYRRYLALLNGNGSIQEIEQAELEMLEVLKQKLFYLMLEQFLITVVFVVFGSMFINKIGMGFTGSMIGTFQLLCMGYAFYVLGNVLMTILLYFSDVQGAFFSAVLFAVSSIVCTIGSLWLSSNYYGIGFLISGFLFVFIALYRLVQISSKLQYYILSIQPLVAFQKDGFWFRVSKFLSKYL